MDKHRDSDLNKLSKTQLITLIKNTQRNTVDSDTADISSNDLSIASIESLLDRKLNEQTTTILGRIELLENENEKLKKTIISLESRLDNHIRQNNIIIHGVNESENCLNSVSEIGNVLSLDINSHIVSCRRLGKIRDNNVKPRPILVETNKLVSRNILKNAKNLRTSEKFKKVFISPDLSRTQLEERRKLQAHLQQLRRDFPQDHYTIRSNKIFKNNTEQVF